jgi:uncharacterized protein YhaN
MRIHELNLIRYGKFTERRIELPFSEQDIHLIVGPNEAGKSTVRSAIGDWLFGIPTRTPLAFLHPMPELRIGGSIERAVNVASEDGSKSSLAFDRTKGNKNTLRTPQDALLPDTVLQPWLGGLDASAFNRMYALDHAMLVEGGAGILSASDDLGRMLFQSASGMEHLGQVLQRLQDEEDALWAPRKSASREYYIALEAFNKAHEELTKGTLRTRDWKAQHEALIECERALNLARQRHAETRAQISRLERIRRVQPLLLSLDASQNQLDGLLAREPTPLLPEDAAAILNKANQAMALADADIQRHQAVIAEAQTELEKIQVDHQMLSLASDINDLNERRLQYRAHRTDIVKRQEELRLEWKRASEKAAGLGWTCATIDEMSARVPAQSIRSRLNRLLKGRGLLIDRRQVAEENLLKRQQEIAAFKEALQAPGSDAVNPKLMSATERALIISDHDEALLEFDSRLRQLGDEIESALAELGAWRASPESLASMSVPDPATVQEVLNEQRADAAEEKSLSSALDAKKSECERARVELEQLVRTFQPVSIEQVLEARASRNSRWKAIKAAPQELPALAPDYEISVSQADGLSDTRLDKLQHEADRQSKTQRLELLEQEFVAMQARLQSVLTRIGERNARWVALVKACGLPQMPPELASHWLSQRSKALGLLRVRSEVERQRKARIDAAEAARKTLWAAIKPEARIDEAPELAECLRMAREQITLADQAQGQRKTLEAQLAEASASLPALQNTRNSANQAWQEWEASWLDSVKAAGYAESVLADQVEAELEVIAEIDRLLIKIRGIQTERIDTMQADLNDLSRTATELGARLAPDLDGKFADEIIIELVRRLDAAKRSQIEWKECQTRLKIANAGLDAASQAQRTVQAQLAPLFAVANVDTESLLAEAIARSEQRRALEKSIAQADAELKTGADGLSMEQLRAEAAAQDSATLMLDLERLNQQAGEILEEVSALSKQHGAQKAAFDAFTGADLAAKAEAQKHEAVARMSDAVERYLRTHTVARLLKWSMEKFRETKQGPMLAKASAIFRTLTLDSFSRLLVDPDGDGGRPRLFGVRPDGRPVDVAGMSEGTRDQLYLALRLAALEIQIAQGFNMPLIADDLFINFDDRRTEAGLHVLSDLSRNMQVIFLTHHDHLTPLAREILGADLNVVVL